VPGYLQDSDALKKLGIDEVIIYCVNDGAVMDAWAKDQGVDKQSFITLMGDPSAVFTKAVGMELIHPGPVGKGLYSRCKRFAMYVEKGVVKVLNVAEAPDDPAGDDKPDVTLAPSMIKVKPTAPLRFACHECRAAYVRLIVLLVCEPRAIADHCSPLPGWQAIKALDPIKMEL